MSLSSFVKNSSVIAIAAIFILIIGQDLYIFSTVGPEIDLTEGPEGIKDAQQFANLRDETVAITTHGLLLGILLVLLTRKAVVVSTIWNKEDGAPDNKENTK